MFQCVSQSAPVISHQLGKLDALDTPVLEKSAHKILAMLEGQDLVTNTLFDEYAACMLLDN
jgi:hypothetical protein